MRIVPTYITVESWKEDLQNYLEESQVLYLVQCISLSNFERCCISYVYWIYNSY